MVNARGVAIVVIASAALALAGCTVDDGRSGTPTPTQSFATPAQVCPEQLPLPPDGSTDPWELATDVPELPEPYAAWLCKYTVAIPEAGGAWETLTWSREGEPVELVGDGLDVAGDLLGGLSAFPDEIACTDDLGPRWLVAVQMGDEVWGATIDDYGCRWVRLTEDPFAVAAGHSDDPRLTQGSLQPPDGIVAALKAAAGLA